MNSGESSGKKSCNGREDGDAPTGSERPLKKARFAWQIKGKHHLKTENEPSHSNTSVKVPELTPEVSSEQAATSGQAATYGQAATNQQAAPNEKAATNGQAATSEQAATNHQAGSNGQAARNVQTATNEEAASNEPVATNRHAGTDEQEETNELATSNRHAATNHIAEGGGIAEDNPVNDDSHIDSDNNSDSSSLTPTTSMFIENLWYPRHFTNSERQSKIRYINKWTNHSRVYIEDTCIAEWQAVVMMKCCIDNTLNEAFERWCSTGSTREANEATRQITHQVSEFINHFPGPNSVENEGIMMAISEHGLRNTIDNARFHAIVPGINIVSPIRSLSPVSEGNNEHIIEDQEASEECENAITSLSEPHTSNSLYDDHNHNSDVDGESSTQTEFDFMNTAVLNAIQNKGLTVTGTEYG